MDLEELISTLYCIYEDLIMEPLEIICYAALTILIIFGVLLFMLFLGIPCIFRWSTTVQKQAIFLPFLHRREDLDKPENEGLEGCRNFYFNPEPDIKLGVWHILPRNLVNSESFTNEPEWFEKSLSASGQPIIIYFHGTTGTRALEYRIGLYKLFQNLNYHVICCDYRGFGDSTRVIPNKNDVVRDSIKFYEYVKELAKDTPIIVHGHSLGSGISVEVLANLCQDQNKCPPTALILESPFNNIHEAFKLHPKFKIWKCLPGPLADWFFTKRLTDETAGFVSDQIIDQVSVPILFLHAKDDVKVPYVLGQKLYQTAIEKRSNNSNPIEFVSFDAELNLGHRLIYSAPDASTHIENFVTKSISNSAKIKPASQLE